MKTPSRETAAQAEEARTAEAAKTARLRTLRLSKEAADRNTEHSAPANRAEFKPGPRAYGSIRPGRSSEAG